MPMVVTDPRQPDSPIVLANQAFLDLTGYSGDEVIGRNCRFLQGPETAEADVEEIRRGLAADNHFISVELLNYRKDGSTFWNQLSISPVHDESGSTIYHFASQKDVSARRRAEELEAVERLLLMEIDHRAMNALALVESILSLTRAEDVHRFSAAVRGRVEAVARAHRLLARSSWTGAHFDELVAEQVAPSVVDAGGPKVQVPPQLVQPVALVLHELISNARKHGALARSGGSVRVHWEVSPGRLLVKWIESGAGPTAVPDLGLGLNLTRSIVERQLAGTASFEWGREGLKAHLVIPLPMEQGAM